MRNIKVKALRQMAKNRGHYRALKKAYHKLTQKERETIWFSVTPRMVYERNQ